uniref:DUF4806 domain-containing protein n=1 Tax=Photinus pyralis TaxID=7054 RepID=A0A1Y1K5M7_PHOPY
MAAFNVVQFEEKDGSSVAIVHREWLTPRKTEVFWPPHKRSASFYKCLRDGETVQSDWKLYKIKKIFYSCDDYDDAKEKEKLAEVHSDFEDTQVIRKRPRVLPLRFQNESGEEEETESQLSRPPKILNTAVAITNADVCQGKSQKSRSPSTISTVSRKNSLDCRESSNLPSTSQSNDSVQSRCSTPVTPSSTFSGNQVFQSRFIGLLSRVVEQNKEILHLLKNTSHTPQHTQNCPDLPVTLPLSKFEDFLTLENYLGDSDHQQILSNFLSTLDKTSLVSATNAILKYCVSFRLAKEFSYLGTRNNKKPFSVHILKKVIVGR